MVEKTNKNWLGLVVLARQDMRSLDDLLAARHRVEPLLVNSALKHREKKFDVELLHAVHGVAVIPVDGDVEDSGAAGPVVLLNLVDAGLHVVDDTVLVLDKLLKLRIFFL